MARSKRLRLREVRQAMRVVGECRDLGHDTRAWLAHALGGVQQLLGANVVLGAMAPAEGFRLHSQLSLLLSIGWESPAQERVALAYLAGEQHLRDPAFQRFTKIARPNITLRPMRLISRKVFDASEFHAFRKTLRIEDQMFSQRETANRRATFSLAPQRAPAERWFDARELKLLQVFHAELARLVGNVLCDGSDDPLGGLSPRQRQTLTLLLSGDSEKGVALRMGLSRHTVHDHVIALYKHFGVNSRAELMALCHRRGVVRTTPNGLLSGHPGAPPI
ncbi:MAG TPA: helix-turn-helix transcriptional regulator [Gemmataceae bacterium]|nr:helix-turn-helix transcriptional regulator [Gemmataceae bacterium]